LKKGKNEGEGLMITLEYNGQKIEVDEGKTVYEILKNEIEENHALGCKFNNEVKSLDYAINESGKIKLINYFDVDGKRIYNRTILYIFTKALKETYPKALLTVEYQIGASMYCEIDNMEPTEEFLDKVKIKMKEIVQKDIPIKKVVMTQKEAQEFYEKEKSIRGIVQMDAKETSGVSLYYCEDYYNYFYGVMPLSTGVAKVFDIEKYRNGFIIIFPDKDEPSKISAKKESKKLFNTLEEYDEIHSILGINTIYKLNKRVHEGTITDNILLAEALHEKKIANIADKIAKKKNIKMVLIAGPSSSGKTTFAKRLGLQLKLNGLKPVTISVDDYFVEREETPFDSNGNYDFECIEAIDLELFNKHISALLNGETINMPTFDFAQGHKVYNDNFVNLEDDEILVIEGIHCLNDKLTSAIPTWKKFKIYISALTVLNIDYHNRIATTDTRLIRRIVRDNQFRNYSALHTLNMWYSVNRGEEMHIFPYQEEADAMFNSSLVYELGVLREFAIPLLMKIDKSEPEYSEAKRLIRLLKFFEPIGTENIPNTSLLREFIGGSIFEKM